MQVQVSEERPRSQAPDCITRGKISYLKRGQRQYRDAGDEKSKRDPKWGRKGCFRLGCEHLCGTVASTQVCTAQNTQVPHEHRIGATVSAETEDRAGFSSRRGLSEAVSETPWHAGLRGAARAAPLLQLDWASAGRAAIPVQPGWANITACSLA